MKEFVIPVFIVNLEKRKDRRASIIKEFSGRAEFTINLKKGYENEIGAVGLWETLKEIVFEAVQCNYKYIIVCEDDHEFTDDYTSNKLFACIKDAYERRADILLGGVSWFNTGFKVSDDLFWVQKFSGLQFTVIYKSFYEKILSADFGITDNADHKLADLSNQIFFIYPFLSIQKEFGYSDITSINNELGRIPYLFKRSAEEANQTISIQSTYKNRLLKHAKEASAINIDSLKLTAYILSNVDQSTSSITVKQQYDNRPEFEVKILCYNALEHENIDEALWRSVQSIIKDAMLNDEDIVIISQDNHRFTRNYSKSFLFENIIKAYFQGASLLYCGTSFFSGAVPLTDNICWVKMCYSIQFVIVYKCMFERIISQPLEVGISPVKFLSELTSNKLLLFPFLSEPTKLEGIRYSDYSINDEMVIHFSYQKAVEEIQNVYNNMPH